MIVRQTLTWLPLNQVPFQASMSDQLHHSSLMLSYRIVTAIIKPISRIPSGHRPKGWPSRWPGIAKLHQGYSSPHLHLNVSSCQMHFSLAAAITFNPAFVFWEMRLGNSRQQDLLPATFRKQVTVHRLLLLAKKATEDSTEMERYQYSYLFWLWWSNLEFHWQQLLSEGLGCAPTTVQVFMHKTHCL